MYKELTEKERKIVSNFDEKTVKEIMTPMNDYIFKKLFGAVGREKLIKEFLEAILDIKIEEVELGLETILMADEIDEKTRVLDVRVKLADGTDIDVEIQNSKDAATVKRSHFYASRMYGRQINSGIYYGELKKVIVIFITNFEVFPKMQEYHTKWLMTEQKNKEEYFEEIELHFIEMPKFLSIKRDESRVKNQWLIFLDSSDEEGVKRAMAENESIREAKEELDKLQQDAHTQYLAWLRQKYILEKNSARYTGLIEGREEGERNNKIEIARKMLKKGVEINFIHEITELTEEEIEKIRDELDYGDVH